MDIDNLKDVYTSYFYQIRFFPKNLIPFSTAIWNPTWYDAPYKPNSRIPHLDKRNVVVGMKAMQFMPGNNCDGLCKGKEGHGTICNGDPNECDFLKVYEKQLDRINPDRFIENYYNKCKELNGQFKLGQNPEVLRPVLIVWESPNNLCSEREIIKKWLDKNNLSHKEFIHKKCTHAD